MKLRKCEGIKHKDMRNGKLEVKIPIEVKINALDGLTLKNIHNFKGATSTGVRRGVQLSTQKHISIKDLADMRTWFARHGPDAKHNGTSYPGYCRWVDMNQPIGRFERKRHKGAVSWLLWGGDAAYLWLKRFDVRQALKKYFPKRKVSSDENNLIKCT